MATLDRDGAGKVLAAISQLEGEVPNGHAADLPPIDTSGDPFEVAAKIVERGERLIAEAEAQSRKIREAAEGFVDPASAKAYLGREDKLSPEARQQLQAAVDTFRDDALREAEDTA